MNLGEELIKKLDFWLSDEGQELQLCLVAQGYENVLFDTLLLMFGSGFTTLKIIKEIEKEVKDGKEKTKV